MSAMESDLATLAAVFGPLQTLVVAGAQWGDEGKGKIAALLSEIFDLVARFSGGSNAGHTSYTRDGRKIVSHQIPCGLAAGKPCILGPGLMFDPIRFADEYAAALDVLGDKMPRVLIDQRCTVWTPWHVMLESWVERNRAQISGKTINTTKRGVGPMAAIRDLRIDIKASDLTGPREILLKKLDQLYETFLPILEAEAESDEHSEGVPMPQEVADMLLAACDVLHDRVVDTAYQMRQMLKEGHSLLFETAQATGLDPFAGTNPFVSSGMSTSAGAAYGAIIPPGYIKDVLVVAKLCPTRVGAGPFVSEIWDREGSQGFPQRRPDLFEPGVNPVRDEFLRQRLDWINSNIAKPFDFAQYLQVLLREVGASTGRGRSVGYPDIPMLRYAVEVNGARYLALTCLDAMSGLNEIPIVIDYKLPGGGIMPRGSMATTDQLYEAEPVIQMFPGWSKSIHGCKREEDLPEEALDVIRFIEDETNTHVLIVGTGAQHDAIIVRPPLAVVA